MNVEIPIWCIPGTARASLQQVPQQSLDPEHAKSLVHVPVVAQGLATRSGHIPILSYVLDVPSPEAEDKCT